jgi:hypothetical protein
MVVVVLALLILTVATAIDALSRPAEHVRALPPQVWALITLVPLVGPLAWLRWGRPVAQRGEAAPVRRPRGPDDDEDFLRRL